MSYKPWIILFPLLMLGLFSAFTQPVTAGSNAQIQYQTPTARPDGRVIYVVQEGDSCLRIELLTGTTIETLRTLNKLDQNCTINPGQELLLMVVTPAVTPTPNPGATATSLLPTPTPVKGKGEICVLLYDDVNGDAVHEQTEFPLAGGAASITDRLNDISLTVNTTAAEEALCQELPEGNYSISMAIPTGYNPTVSMTTEISLKPGEQAILEFGAQRSTQVEAPTVSTPASNSNLLLAVMGGLLVLAGIGMGGYILLSRRS